MTHRTLPYPKSFPTPEETAFLQMAVSSDQKFPDLWRQWKSTADWQQTDIATARLLTYLYPRLQTLGIRDDFTERVKGVHKAAWVRNQLFLRAAKEIAEICRSENIPVLMLKGIPLIFEVYGNVGSRPLGDADILVHPEDGKRLTDLLRARGWRYAKEWAADRHNPALSIYKITKATELRDSRGLEVDLHYNIFNADHGMSLADVFLLKQMPSLSFPEQFWREAVPMHLDNVECLRLSNEDTLLHLIVHGAEGNSYRAFRWVLDALLLIQRLPIDWEKLLRHAEDFGYTLELRFAFLYLKEHFAAPVPDTFMQDLLKLPVGRRDLERYYRVTNIEHAKRIRVLGNIPLLWYAYWKFEKKASLFGFFSYARKTWGLKSYGEVFGFAVHHLQRKIAARKT